MLGLHDFSSVCVLVTVFVLVLIAVGIIRLLRVGGEVAAMLLPFAIAAFGVVALTGWSAVNSIENGLDARDKMIRAELATAGIAVVEFKSDDRLEVRRDGCTAVFVVKSRGEIDRASRPWPLVLEGGWVVSGCEGKDLNTFFGPPRP